MTFLHLELGDAVAQQTADAVGTFEDCHGVAGPRELLGGSESRRPGSDDGDGSAGLTQRGLRLYPAVVPGLVDDRHFDLLDGHGRLVDPQDAGRLARRRAQAPGELREVVGGVQALDGAPEVAAPHQVVPFRDQVPERTTVVAEGDAAIHAPAGLRLESAVLELLVDLFPVPDPDVDGAPLRQLPAGFHEPTGISHCCSPPSLPRRGRVLRVRPGPAPAGPVCNRWASPFRSAPTTPRGRRGGRRRRRTRSPHDVA